MPYGKGAILTKVSYDRDGYPSSLTFKMADGSPLADDKVDLVGTLKDKGETLNRPRRAFGRWSMKCALKTGGSTKALEPFGQQQARPKSPRACRPRCAKPWRRGQPSGLWAGTRHQVSVARNLSNCQARTLMWLASSRP